MSPRPNVAADVELIANIFDFPTSLAFDDKGTLYVAESGLPFDGAPPGGRIWRLRGESRELIAEGLRQPVNGLTWHDGSFLVAEGGRPGRISRVTREGERSTVIDNLPAGGNYHTNMVAVGPDGKLYWGQGAMSNSAVVGLDAFELGWLGKLPHPWDLPGWPLEVDASQVFETRDPTGLSADGRARTQAFAPFDEPTGPRRAAALPCTSAILRCNADGSGLELYAWGVRNAYGLLFLPDGRLIATDQGADDRGSRPIGNAPELVYEIKQGAWYGWPDFIGGVPVEDSRFVPTRGPAPRPLIKNHHQLPKPEPALLELPCNTAATKLACLPGGCDRLVVALFGDERPMTGPPGPKVGRCLADLDLATRQWRPIDIAIPWNRPIDIAMSPAGDALYVLDFGSFELSATGFEARRQTGAVWKIPLTALPPR